jgi:hypothetical protein
MGASDPAAAPGTWPKKTAGALDADELCTIGEVARAIESRFVKVLHESTTCGGACASPTAFGVGCFGGILLLLLLLCASPTWPGTVTGAPARLIPPVQLPTAMSLKAWFVAGDKLPTFTPADLQKPWTSYLNPGQPLLLRYQLVTVTWRPPQNTILRHLARAYEKNMARGTKVDDPLFDDFNKALDEMTVQKGSTSRAPSQGCGFFLCSCSICARRKGGANNGVPIASERMSFPTVSERPGEDNPLASPGNNPNTVAFFNRATIDSSKPTSSEPTFEITKPTSTTASEPPPWQGLHQGKRRKAESELDDTGQRQLEAGVVPVEVQTDI